MRSPSIVTRSEEHTLNSSHTEIYTLSLHDALPISLQRDFQIVGVTNVRWPGSHKYLLVFVVDAESVHCYEIGRAHVELQSHRDLHSFPTRRSSDLASARFSDRWCYQCQMARKSQISPGLRGRCGVRPLL